MNSGTFDHGKSVNRNLETIGSILRAPWPKNLKKSENFKVIISWFPKSDYPNPPRGNWKS